MRLLSDNDVIGAVESLHRAMIAGGWNDFTELLDLQFLLLRDVGLSPDASDSEVWHAARLAEAILITGNRSSGENSLDRVIEEHSGPDSLPVLTIADPRRVMRDTTYATSAAIKLLNLLLEVDSLRGVGRLYLP